MAKPKIGIIGDRNVGSARRRGLERSGYEVPAVGKDPLLNVTLGYVLGLGPNIGFKVVHGQASLELAPAGTRKPDDRLDVYQLGGFNDLVTGRPGSLAASW